MECLECVNCLWEYLDDELGAKEVLAVRCHLSLCGGCRPAYEFDRAFLALLARCRTVAPSPTPALREAVRLRLALIR